MAQRPILRLRNRRRRRRPAAPGLLPGTADSTAPSEQASAATDEAGADGTPGTPPAQRSFRVPRRRRRHAPLSAPAAGEATPGEGAPGASDRREPGTETARPRNRNRRRTAGPPRTGTEGTAQPGERDNRGPGQRGHRGDRPAADGQRSEGRRDGGPRAGQRDGRRDRRDGPPGRGRRDAPRPIERKLYSMDSVVDRGFDDVEEEAGTRRVHWTIVKRTTADQLSRKAVSAAYVLQRDGVDSEFPSLGAARAAVNKTIVHPEKLTRSKAEYAAERSAKK
jgi:hypothetical protein